MFFTFLLCVSALFVAGCAAYFSVLGIATLFAGSFLPVVVMASSLELGKLLATSFLYRYWNKTAVWLKSYLIIAVVILMFITSLGIFGYLSAAYQVNASKFSQVDQQIALIESQKINLEQELQQNTKRIEMLNQVRVTQEQRVQEAGNYRLPREQAYAAIDKANQELQTIAQRNQVIQTEKFQKDQEILQLNQQFNQVKDVGTFKFVADTINKPLDKIVIIFICILISVFDPLAVALILALNIATKGSVLKEQQTAVTTELPSTIISTPTEQPLINNSFVENEPEVAHSTITGKIKATGKFVPKV